MSQAQPCIEYDPSCVECRRDAGKDAAGTTWQCVGHVYLERDRLRTALATAERERDEARVERDTLKAKADEELDAKIRLATVNEQLREEARWNPLEDYHKRHVPGCRKHMYDQKSSPCSCVVEYERELLRANVHERWANNLREERDHLLELLREVRRDVAFACDRYAENAYTKDEQEATNAAFDRLESIDCRLTAALEGK